MNRHTPIYSCLYFARNNTNNSLFLIRQELPFRTTFPLLIPEFSVTRTITTDDIVPNRSRCRARALFFLSCGNYLCDDRRAIRTFAVPDDRVRMCQFITFANSVSIGGAEAVPPTRVDCGDPSCPEECNRPEAFVVPPTATRGRTRSP